MPDLPAELVVPAGSPDGPPAGLRTFVVPDGSGHQRVDRFVADMAGLSRSYVQRLISDGRLTHDGVPLKANVLVSAGDILALDVPEPARLDVQGEAIPLVVAYEDDDLLVINKPSGLVVHPSPGHDTGTLVNALLGRADGAEYGGIAGVRRPGIVHRLDRDTSGLLMVAKTDLAQSGLMAQLKGRRVKKTYQALVQGSVAAAVGRIEAPIGRDPEAAHPDGRGQRWPAVNHRLPRPRAVRRLDPSRAGPDHRSDPPDPGPSRCHRPSHRGRSGLRHGHLAARPGRAGAPLPACLEARVQLTQPG